MARFPDMAGGVAVVTGGAGSIGMALGRTLLALGAGRLYLADRPGQPLDEAVALLRASDGPGTVIPLPLDVSDAAAVDLAVEAVWNDTGRIDVWFSNAGVSRGDGIGTMADWEASIGVNLMGHVNAARCVLPLMIERGGGHFSIMASAAGLLSDLRSAPYSATKHAAVALAEWLAIIYGGDAIEISCICPEAVRTAMTRNNSAEAAPGMEVLSPEELARRVFAGLAEGRFLVLPHPRVAEFEQRRANDRERWINGMRKAARRARGPAAAAAIS